MLINIPAIVYLSFALLIIFLNSKKMSKINIVYEIFVVLIITFIINILCINNLNKIAWYIIAFLTIIPVGLAFLSFILLKIKILN